MGWNHIVNIKQVHRCAETARSEEAYPGVGLSLAISLSVTNDVGVSAHNPPPCSTRTAVNKEGPRGSIFGERLGDREIKRQRKIERQMK